MPKIWYVEFPTFQYNEDVKAIAKHRGLTIVDAKFDAGDGVKDPPELTPKEGEAKDAKEINIQTMIENLDALKAPSLKILAEHLGVEYTNVEETRAAIKAKINEG